MDSLKITAGSLSRYETGSREAREHLYVNYHKTGGKVLVVVDGRRTHLKPRLDSYPATNTGWHIRTGKGARTKLSLVSYRRIEASGSVVFEFLTREAI